MNVLQQEKLLSMRAQLGKLDGWLGAHVDSFLHEPEKLDSGDAVAAHQILQSMISLRHSVQEMESVYDSADTFKLVALTGHRFKQSLSNCVKKTLEIVALRLASVRRGHGGQVRVLCDDAVLMFLRKLCSKPDESIFETTLLSPDYQRCHEYLAKSPKSAQCILLFEAVYYGISEPHSSSVRREFAGRRHFLDIMKALRCMRGEFMANDELHLWPFWINAVDGREAEENFYLARYFQDVTITPSVTLYDFARGVIYFCLSLVDFCTHQEFDVCVNNLRKYKELASSLVVQVEPKIEAPAIPGEQGDELRELAESVASCWDTVIPAARNRAAQRGVKPLDLTNIWGAPEPPQKVVERDTARFEGAHGTDRLVDMFSSWTSFKKG